MLPTQLLLLLGVQLSVLLGVLLGVQLEVTTVNMGSLNTFEIATTSK